jgi:TctA family transporter
MRKFGLEGALLMMGLVLGPMFELAFRQSLIYGNLLIFPKRLISVVLLPLV